MHMKKFLLLGALLLCGCFTFAPQPSRALVSISRTNGGVVSISDRTDIHANGRVYTGHRSVWERMWARKSRLSAGAMRELREILDGPEFARVSESLSSRSYQCGAMEEDTVIVQYPPRHGENNGFCVNDRDITPQVLDLIDRIESPLIRELGERYTTRAGAAVRRGRG